MAIDRQALRQAIANAPADGSAAIVTKGWLKQLDRELADYDRLRGQHAPS